MSNASPSQVGWDFQYNSAIVLLLDNIREVEKIRVEGKTEDIELYLNNGNVVYSQAKYARVDIQNKKFRADLIDALRTLTEASQKDNVEYLVYVTNIIYPLGKRNSTEDFGLQSCNVSYVDLSSESKAYIQEIVEKCEYDLDLKRLSFRIIGFKGESENQKTKYGVILHEIQQFLSKIGGSHPLNEESLRENMSHIFFENSSKPKFDIVLTKKDIVWYFIVCLIDTIQSNIEGYDAAEQYELSKKYQELINNNVERFAFSTKVLFDFTNWKKKKNNRDPEIFSEECWSNYIDDFEIDTCEEEHKEILIKIIIQKILEIRYHIVKVKEASNIR